MAFYFCFKHEQYKTRIFVLKVGELSRFRKDKTGTAYYLISICLQNFIYSNGSSKTYYLTSHSACQLSIFDQQRSDVANSEDKVYG